MSFDFSNYTYSGLIGIFSAIIGMCYPLMLQAIDRIDEKYNVARFVDLFKQERVYRRFNLLLLLSIGFSIVAPFALYLMDNILWMQISVLTCHTFVVLCLLLHVIGMYHIIITYYTPSLFFEHLIKMPDDCLLELIDLAKYAAKNESTSLYNACMQHVYEILLKD